MMGWVAGALGLGVVARLPLGAFATTSTPTAGTPQAGEDGLLLRVELAGGFVPVESVFTALPMVSIYADGRVITTGPMIEIFPQPALPNLRESRLTEAGIAHVLDEARQAGLFSGTTHYDGPEVTDLPDTVFTLNAEGVSTVVSAYALGVDEGRLPSTANAEARQKLIELLAFLAELPVNLPADEVTAADQSFEIEKLRIAAREIDPANPPWEDPAMAQEPMAWPLNQSLAKAATLELAPFGGGAKCAAFEGEEAKALVAALEGANQLTPFESDGKLYQLWVRPLLPDEPVSCEIRNPLA